MSTDALSVRSDHSYAREPIESLFCTKCNVKYPNIHELLTHQAAEKHFACNQCDLCFWNEDTLHDHKRNDHRPELDLECFGCQTHFNSASSFWHHLESAKCNTIYPSDIARLREKNLKFAEQLELRKVTIDDIIQCENSHIKEEDTWASEFGKEPAPTEPQPPVAFDFPSRPAPISAGNAHPLYYRSEDFPALPTDNKATATPNLRRAQKDNAWSDHKVISSWTSDSSPISYNAVPPPASYDLLAVNDTRNTMNKFTHNNKIRIIQAPVSPAESGPHDATSSGRIVNPDHPDYNPAVFYNEILENFVCPYKSCKKKFYNVRSFNHHLRSPAHVGGRISCICCKKSFPTVAQLIGHMETATRCPVRQTDGFRRALGQITGGIIDFHIRSGTFFIDQNSVQELLKLRSGSMPVMNKEKTQYSDASDPKKQKHWEHVQAGW
ncbi:hypothetical protein F5Y07DRAFT_405481 [Xylaria sp. FL0933]|nr:hypothetical protein F5Y07DRAFT_405481 [Xylaria sp. FL0933]